MLTRLSLSCIPRGRPGLSACLAPSTEGHGLMVAGASQEARIFLVDALGPVADFSGGP